MRQEYEPRNSRFRAYDASQWTTATKAKWRTMKSYWSLEFQVPNAFSQKTFCQRDFSDAVDAAVPKKKRDRFFKVGSGPRLEVHWRWWKGGSWLLLCRRGLALAGLDVDLGVRGEGGDLARSRVVRRLEAQDLYKIRVGTFIVQLTLWRRSFLFPWVPRACFFCKTLSLSPLSFLPFGNWTTKKERKM